MRTTHWGFVVLLLAATSAGYCQEIRLVDAPAKGGFVWPSQIPANCPFEQSTELAGVYFTGRHSDYYCGDTWYPCWASDGNLYSPWTDGRTEGVACSSGTNDGTVTQTAHGVMIGDDPLNLVIKNTSPPQSAPVWQPHYRGRYPCGSLVHDGVWYYGTYLLGPAGRVEHEGMRWNWPVLGAMPGFRISTDYGRTWTASPLSPQKPLFPEPAEVFGAVKMGAPHFVDFGRNMEHSPDGKAYLLGMGAEQDDPKPRYANLSWITADQVYLARVRPSIKNINDISKYEFFAGYDPRGRATWSRSFADIRPLLDWNNNMGCVTATYNWGLRKYLMCVTDGWPTVAHMNSYILEADRLTGPWRLVVYMKHFGEQAYFLNFPSKFISKDGRTLWLCYSANFSQGWNNVRLEFNPPGGRYGLCLHELRLLAPGEKPGASLPLDPLKGATNIAPAATVEVSSTYAGYRAEGVIDQAVGGYPGATNQEWASQGETQGAWVRLSWDQPRRIRKVWLFDRPNRLDQITGGTIAFSDGSTVKLDRALPDTAGRGVEISFDAKTVDWLKFAVTAVKPDSPNIGLAEIAVFR